MRTSIRAECARLFLAVVRIKLEFHRAADLVSCDKDALVLELANRAGDVRCFLPAPSCWESPRRPCLYIDSSPIGLCLTA
jgi:hypothetical protein